MNFILQNWQVIIGIIGSAIAFIAGLKTRKVDVRKKEIDALQNMQLAYDKFTEQTNSQIDRLMTEIDLMKKENIEQRKDVRLLQQDNRRLHLEVSKLTEENNTLRKSVEELRKENADLKMKK
ncbi:MAG TPA: hypothetical protein VFM82_09085 [Flavobacteriaceae bacterium]|nr:hypothetical protein [Flavobacteriaceae bacterium]